MLLFALCGLVIGAMLGGLTVAAVIPATLLVLVVAGVVSLVGGDVFGSRTMDVGVLVVCLQLGYHAGAALRFSVFPRVKIFASGRSSTPSV